MREKIKETGRNHRNFIECKMDLSDAQLRSQIKVLDLVIAYLQGRGDASLVVYPLILDRERYIKFQEARKQFK